MPIGMKGWEMKFEEELNMEKYTTPFAGKFLRRHYGSGLSNLSATTYLVHINFNDPDTALALVVDFINRGYKGIQLNLNIGYQNICMDKAQLESLITDLIKEGYPDLKDKIGDKTSQKTLL